MYIVKISPKALIRFNKDELVITSDLERASEFPNIGDAMRAAVEVNEALGTYIAKVQVVN